MSFGFQKNRRYDFKYDPFYKASNMRTKEVPRYRVLLQQTDVGGSDRPLFFRSPDEPDIKATPPYIVRAVETPKVQSKKVERFKPGQKRDISVQTMFRESEAQTDPWLPDTVDGTRPRLWYEEEELNGLSLEQRRKKLIELEVQQWANREREITVILQQRLNAMGEQFQRREDKEAAQRAARVEHVVRVNEEKRQQRVKKIGLQRLKVLRTLSEQRRQMTEPKHTKKDIVKQYADSGSEVYAPLKRNGRADAQAYMHRAVLGRQDLFINQTVSQLDDVLKKTQMKTDVKLKRETKVKRTDKMHMDALDIVQRSVDEKRGLIEEKVPTLKIAQRIEKPPPRPDTPNVESETDNDELELAVILLQRLIRGRALQGEMYTCLEKQRQLIRELRTVEALREVEEHAETEEEKEAALQARLKREKAAQVQGQVVGDMLVFLNNQLRRRIEERKIDAMMKLAERDRRMREAVEAGRREQELAIQKMEDEAFRRIMGVNYETTESYLESIINQSIETAADQLATETAMRDAEKITKFTSTVANRGNDEVIVARDLVAAFLFPEVERDCLRKRLRIEQKKFRHAAEQTVQRLRSPK